MWFYPIVSTGKERDEETGYGYFGARYMDHELTAMWLSVDPMSDKYPSISPYAYCAWNPVKLVDPDGNEAIDNDDGWKVDRKNKTIANISPIGGDGFHHVSGDDCYQFSGSSTELLTKYEGYTVINADGTQLTNSNSNNGTAQSSGGSFTTGEVACNYIEGFAKGWQNTSNKDKYDIVRKQHVKGRIETKPGEAKRAVNRMTGKGSPTMKHCGRVGASLSLIDFAESYYIKDNGSFGINSAGSAGSAIGGWAGARIGAIAAAKVGAFWGPWGAIVGGVVGGVAGGLGGDKLGNSLGRSIYGSF